MLFKVVALGAKTAMITEQWILCRNYLPYMYAVLRWEGIGSRNERVAKALLLHSAAGFFHYQGQWEDAEKFQTGATDLNELS